MKKISIYLILLVLLTGNLKAEISVYNSMKLNDMDRVLLQVEKNHIDSSALESIMKKVENKSTIPVLYFKLYKKALFIEDKIYLLDKIIEEYPQSTVADSAVISGLELLLLAGETNKYADFYKKIADMDINDKNQLAQVDLLKAKLEIMDNDLEQAKYNLRLCLYETSLTENEEALKLLGQIYFSQKKYQEAIRIYNDIILLYPTTKYKELYHNRIYSCFKALNSAENDTLIFNANTEMKKTIIENKEIINKHKQDNIEITGDLKKYYVQVASYKNKPIADEKLLYFKNQGYTAKLQQVLINNNNYYRLWIGPFEKRADAAKLLKEVKSKYNIQGLVIKY